jgi:hypothetical protein
MDMKMLLGCDEDTKTCFSYDSENDIQHADFDEACVEEPPCSLVEAMVLSSVYTSGFYVGSKQNRFSVVFPDGKCYLYQVLPVSPLNLYSIREKSLDQTDTGHICFAGYPDSFVLNNYPNSKTYVLNVGRGAVALGYLLYKMLHSPNCQTRSRRRWFLTENSKPIKGVVGNEYEPNLDSDASGKMAHRCLCATPVVNERFSTIGESAFHDRVLFHSRIPDVTDKYLLSIQQVLDFFPAMPLSWQYAASCVTMSVENNDKFNQKTGDNSDRVNIRIVTGLSDMDTNNFSKFSQVFSNGESVIATASREFAERFDSVFVYRYDRFYKVDNYKVGKDEY